MLEIPGHISLIFILTTLLTYILFVLAMLLSPEKRIQKLSNIAAILLLLWLIFQSTLALNKWYMDRNTVPPHMLFPVATCIILISTVFLLPRGKKWLDGLSLKVLTWIHIVRLPVECCLFLLATHRQLPWSMTFEGYNYDIVFGITAPIVAFLYFNRKKVSRTFMLIWNILGLASVLAVVVRGIGAVPSPMQAWDFHQPNYAVLHFPFIWLPAFIVPVVIFSHLVSLRRLRRSIN